MLDFRRFDVISFDCYGTLINWERGILDALQKTRSDANRDISDGDLLEAFAIIEQRLETGHFMPYRLVLRGVMRELVQQLEVPAPRADLDALGDSLPRWRAFPDTVEALRRLKRRYKLAIISNTDRALFAETARALDAPFDWVITAEDVGSYKPSHKNFEHALATMGIPKERVLHVAQSRFHDIAPAHALGIANVWVNRRHGVAGEGATAPSLAVADFEVPDLKTLADLVEARA